MTRTEADRLTRMEDNQENFKEALEKVFSRLDDQDKLLRGINKTLDELTGGKKALMWLTGVSLSIAGLIIAFFKVAKDK